MKTAIVGCGGIAVSHMRILRKLKPKAQVFLCDVDRHIADMLAARFPVKGVYSDFQELLALVKPETVHILTPPRYHMELAQTAIVSGCHVFVEKPVAEKAEDYLRVRTLAQERKRLLCCDYSTLGMPVVMRAIQEIHSGGFGRLIAVHCDFAGSEGGGLIPYKNHHHWAYCLEGGVLQNMIDHPASLILAVLGPIKEFKFSCMRRNMLPHDCPDLIHVVVQSQDELGSFTLSLGHGRNERHAHFMLEKGSIAIDMGRQLYSSTKGRGPQNFLKKGLSGIGEGFAFAGGTVKNIVQTLSGRLMRDPGIANVMASFYKSIETGEEPLVKHATVQAVTTLLDAIWSEIGQKEVPETQGVLP